MNGGRSSAGRGRVYLWVSSTSATTVKSFCFDRVLETVCGQPSGENAWLESDLFIFRGQKSGPLVDSNLALKRLNTPVARRSRLGLKRPRSGLKTG